MGVLDADERHGVCSRPSSDDDTDAADAVSDTLSGCEAIFLTTRD